MLQCEENLPSTDAEKTAREIYNRCAKQGLTKILTGATHFAIRHVEGLAEAIEKAQQNYLKTFPESTNPPTQKLLFPAVTYFLIKDKKISDNLLDTALFHQISEFRTKIATLSNEKEEALLSSLLRQDKTHPLYQVTMNRAADLEQAIFSTSLISIL